MKLTESSLHDIIITPSHLFPNVFEKKTQMKTKGGHTQNPQGKRHEGATHDDRLKVIALCENAGRSWRQIEAELKIDFRTC